MSSIPKEIKVGTKYSTSWASKPSMSWKLIDVTRNKAYLVRTNGEMFSTNVNDLRIPETKKNGKA